MSDNKHGTRQLKNKRTILTYLSEKGIVREHENVIYAEKAFLVNSILLWCVRKCDEGEYTPHDVRFYFDSIDRFIREEVMIYWDESGSLVIGN